MKKIQSNWLRATLLMLGCLLGMVLLVKAFQPAPTKTQSVQSFYLIPESTDPKSSESYSLEPIVACGGTAQEICRIEAMPDANGKPIITLDMENDIDVVLQAFANNQVPATNNTEKNLEVFSQF